MIPSHHLGSAGRQGQSVREHIKGSLYAISDRKSATSLPNREKKNGRIGLEWWTVSDKDILNLGQQNYGLVTNCNLLWYQQEQIHFSV